MNAVDIDPLVQCLLAIATYNDTASSAESITAGLPLVDGRLTPSLFARAATRVGMNSQLVVKPLSELHDKHALPVILLLGGESACVLAGWNDDHSIAVVIFPELNTSVIKVKIAELEARYTGNAIFVRPVFQFDQGSSKRKHEAVGHWFWQAIFENSSVYRDVLLAAFFINLFALSMPLFVMNVYDRVVPNHAVETLWVLAIGVAIMLIADMTLRSVRAYFLDLAGRRVDVKLSAQIMEKVMGIKLEARPNSVGAFASNLRSFEMVREFITSASITTLIDLPFALIFIVVIGWIALPILIPAIIAIAVMLLYALATQARLRELSESIYAAGAMRNSTLIESLVGMETLKALGAEGNMQRKWEKTTSYLARVGIQMRLLSSSSVNIAQWAQQMCSVAVIIIGVYLITAGELSMGGLIACNMLASRVLAPFAQAAGLIMQYHTAATSLKSLEEIMAKPVERPAGRKFLSHAVFAGDLAFNNVTFGYPESEMNAVEEISFKINAGETVAVLGRVGSGKSTLLKLTMGLFTPTDGAISVDGIDIRQLDPADLRYGVGYVPQDGILFRGTLRENLMIAQRHVNDSDLMRAAEIAGLDGFIKRHPKGLDMEVGERGDSLSGGQRKAVALARAIVHSPPVLLLDEPTGSMDHSTEAAVVRNLKEYGQGRTMFIVTHRTSLLEMADRILVVDNGKIVADGPRENVIEALRQGKIGKSA
ncbi:MAG: ATP-binding cassette subfamily C protein LapB [Candidatus Azotimanducaceae bacterium]|jgi:ATP-binding cassette subfamily C protein LapB